MGFFNDLLGGIFGSPEKTKVQEKSTLTDSQDELLDYLIGQVNTSLPNKQMVPTDQQLGYLGYLSNYPGWIDSASNTAFSKDQPIPGIRATPGMEPYLGDMSRFSDTLYAPSNVNRMFPGTGLDTTGAATKRKWVENILPDLQQNVLPGIREAWGDDTFGTEAARDVSNTYAEWGNKMSADVIDEIMQNERINADYGAKRDAILAGLLEEQGKATYGAMGSELLADTGFKAQDVANTNSARRNFLMQLLSAQPGMESELAGYSRMLADMGLDINSPYWRMALQLIGVPAIENIVYQQGGQQGLLQGAGPWMLASNIMKGAATGGGGVPV